MRTPETTRIQVFRALEQGRVRQIGLSEEQVHRLCPKSCGVGWAVESSIEEVGIAHGIVVDWEKHGGCGGEHVHWYCPLCNNEHHTDFEPHADSNPSIWFCERYAGMCLVHWQREEPDWALILEYRGFHDVPRVFLVKHRHRHLLFHCSFNDELDDYPTFYNVYLMPTLAHKERQGNWEQLFRRALLYLGEIPVKDVRFDPTLRLAVHVSAFDRFAQVPNLNFY